MTRANAVPGQLDLLATVDPDPQRLVDALTCLHDAVPDAMDVLVHLRYSRTRDSRDPHVAGNWAYSVTKAGLRTDRAAQWWGGARSRGETWGWSRVPAHLVTWGELTRLLGDHPLRPGVLAWAARLDAPDAWRDRMRPYELWPEPHKWHPSYITNDRARSGWPDRIAAWRALRQICTDAITELEMTP